jgi:hypothetical protein
MQSAAVAQSPFLLFRSKDWRRRRHAGPAEVILMDQSTERRAAFERAASRIGIRLRAATTLGELKALIAEQPPDLAISVHEQTRTANGELSAELTEVGETLDSAAWRMNWAAFTETSIAGVVAHDGPPSGIEQLLVGMDASLSPN